MDKHHFCYKGAMTGGQWYPNKVVVPDLDAQNWRNPTHFPKKKYPPKTTTRLDLPDRDPGETDAENGLMEPKWPMRFVSVIKDTPFSAAENIWLF